ncbi:MAG TPA: hypothetical protein VGD19_13515 [Allosphingosinicella sp.]|jgi:hypothetical protein
MIDVKTNLTARETVSQERAPWVRPQLRHLKAGAAEFEIGNKDDNGFVLS